MSTKYKFIDKQGVYFTISTVDGWLDVFTRDIYRNNRYAQVSDLLPNVTNVMDLIMIAFYCSSKTGYMNTKYKFIDKQVVYFKTSTVVGWLAVFTRDVYRNFFLDSIRFVNSTRDCLYMLGY